MLPTNNTKYLFVLLILNIMWNMYAQEDQGQFEEVSTDTDYVVEKITVTWNIHNSSQMHNTVHTEFFQNHTSTSWKLSLSDKKHICLERIDDGEQVFADINVTVKTHQETFHSRKTDRFHIISNPHLRLLDLYVNESPLPWVNYASRNPADYPENLKEEESPLEIENNVFKIKITMKILGRQISKNVRSSVPFSLYQMLNKYASRDRAYFEEDILIDTRTFVEKINVTWNIYNYSHTYDADTTFGQKHTSAAWKLILIAKKYIYLYRFGEAEPPVFVAINAIVISHHRRFQVEKTARVYKMVRLLSLVEKESYQQRVTYDSDKPTDYPLVEDDVLKVKISMEISGPLISKIVRSSVEEVH